jgi:hypothetical protein
LKDFLELMEEKNWIYTLKPGDDGLHPSPEVSSPIKGRGEPGGKGKTGLGVLSGKPIVKELLAVSTILVLEQERS